MRGHDDLVAAFMRALAEEPADERPLPDARALLRRARLRDGLAAEEVKVHRALFPILLASLAGPAVVALALTALPGLGLAWAAGLFSAAAASLALRVGLAEG